MITKIIMSGVASYKNPTTLETDKKINLIYGLNGTGKSTLSNFLYDRTKADYSSCSVVGITDEEVLVYNNRFVHDHFHETDKLNGIFTLSKENIQAEKDLETAHSRIKTQRELKENIAAKISEIEKSWESSKKSFEEKIWNIKTKYSGGDRVLEFCLDGLMGKKTKLFEHVIGLTKPAMAPTKSIDDLKHEAESIDGEEAQRYLLLPELKFEVSSIESHEIFKRSIVGNQNSTVAGLIKKLDNADWVRNGIEYLNVLAASDDESCPFCQAKTISKAISKAIREYFDESYSSSVNELKDLQLRYSQASESIGPKSSYEGSPFLNDKKEEFEAQYERLLDLARRNIERIEAKIGAPSQEQSLEESAPFLDRVNELIRDANRKISEHNKKIDNKKQELKRIRSEFWEVIRWDYDQVVVGYERLKAESQERLGQQKKELEKVNSEILRLSDRISEIQKTTVNIDSAIENINTRLSDLGIDSFKLVKYKENLYRIHREGEKESNFHSLSEGEKTVISFLYFVELCKGRKRASDIASQKIVVIDDPISSLSHIYVFNVGQMIKTEFFSSSNVKQVFVLTHNLYFFYELTDIKHERRKESQKLFRLTKSSIGSRLVNMRYEEIQNDYQAYWSIIKDSDQPSPLIANCMRNIVEYFFGFVERRDFNNVFQKPALQANKYQAFSRFMNRESHSFGQNVFDYKEFDYAIFHEALKLVFEENGFSEHYAAMMK